MSTLESLDSGQGSVNHDVNKAKGGSRLNQERREPLQHQDKVSSSSKLSEPELSDSFVDSDEIIVKYFVH